LILFVHLKLQENLTENVSFANDKIGQMFISIQ